MKANEALLLLTADNSINGPVSLEHLAECLGAMGFDSAPVWLIEKAIEHIDELERLIEFKDDEIDELERLIEFKDDEIDELKRLIEFKDDEIADLEAEIKELKIYHDN